MDKGNLCGRLGLNTKDLLSIIVLPAMVVMSGKMAVGTKVKFSMAKDTAKASTFAKKTIRSTRENGNWVLGMGMGYFSSTSKHGTKANFTRV